MNMTVKQLVKANNEKRKQLTKENETYYESLLVYIRSSMFLEERSTEELLYEMLDHLLLAQQDGKTAQDVFGKEPQQLADEMIATLPKEKPKKIVAFFTETMLLLVGIYLAIVGVPPLLSGEVQTIYIGSFALIIGVLILSQVIVIYMLLRALKKDAFSSNKFKKLYSVTFIVIYVLVVMIVGAVSVFANDFGPSMQASAYTYFGLGCFLLLASYLLKLMRQAEAK